MRAVLVATVVLAAGLAGCAGPAPAGDAGGDDDAPLAYPAPWWPVGAWWDVNVQHNGAQRAVRLVNFQNASDHFWLGVADRAVAMEHALQDTNPLLGRIHWGILTPHENAIHANGMFTFDERDGGLLKEGRRWSGIAFARDWQLLAERGEGERLAISGSATDGAILTYDYDPDAMWFTFVEVRDGQGRVETRIDVTGWGEGATGTHWFLRGRDYYEGPQGSVEDRFRVEQEEAPVTSMVIEFDVSFAGPGRIDFVDPGGETFHSETVPTGGRFTRTVELPDPAQGEWRVRYVGTGVPEGRVDGTGIIEYRATLR